MISKVKKIAYNMLVNGNPMNCMTEWHDGVLLPAKGIL